MFKHISIEQTAQRMSDESINIVDIRDAQSFLAGHIPNSSNINNQNVGAYIESVKADAPLIVVCYHGHSSQPAAQFFEAQGFTDVYSMDGGFEMWKLSQAVENG